MSGTTGRQAAHRRFAGRRAPAGRASGRQATAALVVGLGSPDRGDDGVGPAVARRVATAAPSEVDVLVYEDPTDLVELWLGRSVAVVVDAVRSGAPAGTVHVLEAGATTDRPLDRGWDDTARGGTHAFGLGAALELARVLDRLPPRLVVVGVEALGFDRGAPLSPEVEAAVPAAAAAVVAALGRAPEEEARDVPG
jgi:hydrogenase maturation protease